MSCDSLTLLGQLLYVIMPKHTIVADYIKVLYQEWNLKELIFSKSVFVL